MKKIKTGLTAIVLLLSISSFATDPTTGKVTPIVKAAFEIDFAKASVVNWEKTEEFYFASFLLNDVKVEAAYTEKGELIGTSRSIMAEQMPLNISLTLAEKYSGYQIAGTVTELNFAGETRYYVTVSNEKHTLRLKCFNDGNIEVETKMKK
jgi:hypothetical protein